MVENTKKEKKAKVGTVLPSGNRVVIGPKGTVPEARKAREEYFKEHGDRNIYDTHVEPYGDLMYVTVKWWPGCDRLEYLRQWWEKSPAIVFLI